MRNFIKIIIIFLCVWILLFSCHVIKGRNEEYYKKIVSVREIDLINLNVKKFNISKNVIAFDIFLGDGSEVFATFVNYPLYKYKGRYPINEGPFNKFNIYKLNYCKNLIFEVTHTDDRNYLIYGVRCDGTAMLSYSDTIKYIIKNETEYSPPGSWGYI